MAFHSRPEKLLDQAAAADTPASDWKIVALYDDVTFHVFGLGAGDTVEIEVSNEDNPSNPISKHSFSGADGTFELPDGYRKARANVTADGGNGSNITAVAHMRKRL